MKLSVCSDMIYWGLDFCQAIEKLSAAGADTIEFWRWSEKNFKQAKKVLDAHNMHVCGFCADSRNKEISHMISVNILNSGKKQELLGAIEESVAKIKEIGAKFLIVTLGDHIEGLSYDEQMQNIKACLSYVRTYLEENNVTLLLEPINRTERQHYIEPCAKPVLDLIREIDSPCIKLLYDIYHQTITGDFSLDMLLDNLDKIGHIHIADVPGRHEPGTGTIDYKTILDALQNANYNGYVGLECAPLGDLATIIKTLKEEWTWEN